MFYDPRHPAKTKEEAIERFVKAWVAVQKGIDAREGMIQFLRKWEALGPEVQSIIEDGHDSIGDILHENIHGFDGCKTNALRAQALRHLVEWRKREGETVKAWHDDSGRTSAFTAWVIEIMDKYDETRPGNTPSRVETLMKRLGR